VSRHWEFDSPRWMAGFDADGVSDRFTIGRSPTPEPHTNKGLLNYARSTMRGDRGGTEAERAIWGRAQRDISILIKGKSGGLTKFEIIGTTLDQLVFAAWDGLYLTLSRELWNTLLSSFSNLLETLDGSRTCSEDPRAVALQLVQSLDCLLSIRYTVWCDCMQNSRSWHFEETPSNQLVGGPVVKEGRR
jgi:hypothetical protein